ncbi:MAG: class I SAM-dependent methyltransferase [Planctomycetaceae bacterium]
MRSRFLLHLITRHPLLRHLGLRHLVLASWLASWLAAAAGHAAAADRVTIDAAVDHAAVIPPPATHHFGREIAQTMHFTGAPWLVRESRQREEDCRLLLEALAVKPGQTICDLGCGNGFYTLELARRVGPTGVVYAVDIQPEMLRMLSEEAGREGLSTIRPVLGTAIDPRLPAGAVDLCLCVDVYHEFSHPADMLARIRESLAPGGRLALVEFRGEDPAVPIKPLHKMTKEQIRRELEPAGFEVHAEFDRLPWQHLVFLTASRPAASTPGKPAENAGFSGP